MQVVELSNNKIIHSRWLKRPALRGDRIQSMSLPINWKAPHYFRSSREDLESCFSPMFLYLKPKRRCCWIAAPKRDLNFSLVFKELQVSRQRRTWRTLRLCQTGLLKNVFDWNEKSLSRCCCLEVFAAYIHMYVYSIIWALVAKSAANRVRKSKKRAC